MLQRKNKRLGFKAESLACKLLQNKGYKILARNFRSKFGEIDIVAMDGDVLVFVEVKARNNLKFGNPVESVTEDKIRKITLTGQIYAEKNNMQDAKMRIDVVSIIMNDGCAESCEILSVDS